MNDRTKDQWQVFEVLELLDQASRKIEAFAFMEDNDRLWLQAEVAKLAIRLKRLPDEDDSDVDARAEVFEQIRLRSLSPTRKEAALGWRPPRRRKTG